MNSEISLKSSHLYLNNELVNKVFKEIDYAYVTYVKDQKRILITPVTSKWFIQLYKPTQFLLKSRNQKGDRTLAIREVLIDNDLDMKDKDLSFEWIKKTNLIKVTI